MTPPTAIMDPLEAADRLSQVLADISGAVRRSGRSAGEVRLLAVSKTFSAEVVEAFAAAGQKDFGESYIQEAREKIPSLPANLTWHFVGHLQTNKAKHAVPIFSVLHSLDSLDLAAELDQRLAAAGRTMRAYVQVNVSGEEQKSGLEPSGLPAFLEAVARFPSLAVEGLMTMPPYDPDPEASRPYFAKLRELRDKKAPKLDGLSMGMSGDFAVAIEEGATLVRIGTSLFGRRD